VKITDFSTGTRTVVVLPRAVAPDAVPSAPPVPAAEPVVIELPVAVARPVPVQPVEGPEDREDWEMTGEQVAAQTRRADSELVTMLWEKLAQTDPAMFAALWRKANSHGGLDVIEGMPVLGDGEDADQS
jgi:hypothetical protein